jgi:hypothetical protein
MVFRVSRFAENAFDQSSARGSRSLSSQLTEKNRYFFDTDETRPFSTS